MARRADHRLRRSMNWSDGDNEQSGRTVPRGGAGEADAAGAGDREREPALPSVGHVGATERAQLRTEPSNASAEPLQAHRQPGSLQLAAERTRRQQMRRMQWHWMRRPAFAPFRSRMDVPQLSRGSRGSGPWRRGRPAHFIDRLEEPEVSDPPRIHQPGPAHFTGFRKLRAVAAATAQASSSSA
jgi:hypothetical protein